MAEFLAPDICVIGGGAGGLAVAMNARASGATVVLVEKRTIGSDALGSSSLAARALATAARRAHYLRTAAPFGIATDEPKINARGVFDHVHSVVEGVAADLSAERLMAQGIELITAEARFVDRKTVAAGDRLIRANHFVIATGSKPAIPQIAGLDSVPYFTSATIFDNPRKLTHLVIIGGGSVGIELAQAFRRLGSDVTVVDIATPLADRDPELVEIALRRLIDEGVVIRPNTTVTGVQMRSLGIGVSVRSGDGGEEMLDASHILVATGRLPNLDGLELLKGGVQWYQKSGSPHLLLRRGLRTSNRRVYAVGDAAGGEQYTQTAVHHARLVVENALFGMRLRNDPSRVPSAIFTDPELAEI
ncbi:MAG: FAD-dependent oxidoreductase, partial [Devosia sp.]